MRTITIEIPDGVEVEVKGGRFIAWITLQFNGRENRDSTLDCRAILDKSIDHLDLPSRKE